MTTYASDGRCHNANVGTFNHECGKPADWIGTKPSGFRSGFCDHCRRHGDERHGFTVWEPAHGGSPADPLAVDVRAMGRDQLRGWYVDVVGYDPFTDDPAIPVATVRQMVAEHIAERKALTEK